MSYSPLGPETVQRSWPPSTAPDLTQVPPGRTGHGHPTTGDQGVLPLLPPSDLPPRDPVSSHHWGSFLMLAPKSLAGPSETLDGSCQPLGAHWAGGSSRADKCGHRLGRTARVLGLDPSDRARSYGGAEGATPRPLHPHCSSRLLLHEHRAPRSCDRHFTSSCPIFTERWMSRGLARGGLCCSGPPSQPAPLLPRGLRQRGPGVHLVTGQHRARPRAGHAGSGVTSGLVQGRLQPPS